MNHEILSPAVVPGFFMPEIWAITPRRKPMARDQSPKWEMTTSNLPNGCAAAWHAMIGGRALAGIFRLVAGDNHMLCYQVMGDLKPTVERFATIQQAQERANLVLSTRICVPR